jgi:hypothetical protein
MSALNFRSLVFKVKGKKILAIPLIKLREKKINRTHLAFQKQILNLGIVGCGRRLSYFAQNHITES